MRLPGPRQGRRGTQSPNAASMPLAHSRAPSLGLSPTPCSRRRQRGRDGACSKHSCQAPHAAVSSERCPFSPPSLCLCLPKCRDPVHSCSFLSSTTFLSQVCLSFLFLAVIDATIPQVSFRCIYSSAAFPLSSLRHRTPASIRETLRHFLISAPSIRPVLFSPANAV